MCPPEMAAPGLWSVCPPEMAAPGLWSVCSHEMAAPGWLGIMGQLAVRPDPRTSSRTVPPLPARRHSPQKCDPHRGNRSPNQDVKEAHRNVTSQRKQVSKPGCEGSPQKCDPHRGSRSPNQGVKEAHRNVTLTEEADLQTRV